MTDGIGSNEKINPAYLSPTSIIDSDNETVIDFTRKAIQDAADPVSKAVRLYYAVRDGIWYDPYYPFHLPKYYRASEVIKSGRAFCIPKAALLCALARSCGIPSRIGFATVRNHLATRQLLERQGSDLFVYHGFTELYLEGRWVKATPAFNIELTRKFKVDPLEFNGLEDSLFHPYNQEHRKYMEYVEYNGVYADVPVDDIVTAWKKTYGEKRVEGWIEEVEKAEGKPIRRFDEEDVAMPGDLVE